MTATTLVSSLQSVIGYAAMVTAAIPDAMLLPLVQGVKLPVHDGLPCPKHDL
jgi:hypothetical protein